MTATITTMILSKRGGFATYARSRIEFTSHLGKLVYCAAARLGICGVRRSQLKVSIEQINVQRNTNDFYYQFDLTSHADNFHSCRKNTEDPLIAKKGKSFLKNMRTASEEWTDEVGRKPTPFFGS